MSDVALRVSGQVFAGWRSARVTRSLETIAGSFTLEVTDRWGPEGERWPIAEEDECSLDVDGEVVLTGYVDSRRTSIDGSDVALSVSGRDAAGDLVDCSALLDGYQLRNVPPLEIARRVAAPFGVGVSLGDGVSLPPAQRRFAVSPGETAFSVVERVARAAGVLAISDGRGGVRLERAGAGGRAEPLEVARNVLAADSDFSASSRYRRYVVLTQTAGTDEASGRASRIRGEAADEGVRRPWRVRVIRPRGAVTRERAALAADWEARTRAARAERVTVTVRGWRQAGGAGALWPLNGVTAVRAAAIGVDGDMLIVGVTHTAGTDGQLTRLTLMRPDAFAPDPVAVVRTPGFKIPAGGAA